MSDDFVKQSGTPMATKDDIDELQQEIEALRKRIDELEDQVDS